LTAELNIHLTDLETGKVSELTHWRDYAVIDDLMNPCASFSATLAATQYQRELTSAGGQKAQVFSYGALQATAIVDERSEATSKSSTDLQIAGRGVGGLLLDSAIDSKYFSLANRTLFQFASDVTTPWQPDFITSVVTNNAGNRYLLAGSKPRYTTTTSYEQVEDRNQYGSRWREKKTKVLVKGANKKFGKASPEYRGIETDSLVQTRVAPDATVWSEISKYSKQIAAHSFVGADGALIITRPTYAFDPSVYGQGIVQRWDRKRHKAAGGNVLRSQYETSIAGRNSLINAWSTGKAKKTTIGKALLKHTWSVKDPGPAFWARTDSGTLGASKLYKPKRVVFKSIRNEKLIRRVCRSMFEDAVIGGFSLQYQLRDHLINGFLPVVDSMINVYDERYNLVGPYYIIR